jgi:hypothetical protein
MGKFLERPRTAMAGAALFGPEGWDSIAQAAGLGCGPNPVKAACRAATRSLPSDRRETAQPAGLVRVAARAKVPRMTTLARWTGLWPLTARTAPGALRGRGAVTQGCGGLAPA